MSNDRFRTLPDPLITLDGRRVTSSEQWPLRRAEILDLFREHVYGREPIQRPESLEYTARPDEEELNGTAIRRQIHIVYKGPGGEGKLPVLIYLPKKIAKSVPTFLFINNRSEMITELESGTSAFWPVEDIVNRGYAAAVFHVKDIDPDVHDGFRNGVHQIFDPPGIPRPSNAWGTIAAWAWGASRVMDYFETDPDINERCVAVVGHSRGGKTALWAGALDERYAMVISNNSGCTGAALSRGKQGETVEIINNGFPHWFAENYKRFNGKEDELPVDQHMLLSLIAPRHLYVTSASEDTWADPQSEFLSAKLAGPVYNLYNLHGLGNEVFPLPDAPLFGDHIGYHVRTGGHDLTKQDWQCFIDYMDRALHH